MVFGVEAQDLISDTHWQRQRRRNIWSFPLDFGWDLQMSTVRITQPEALSTHERGHEHRRSLGCSQMLCVCLRRAANKSYFCSLKDWLIHCLFCELPVASTQAGH